MIPYDTIHVLSDALFTHLKSLNIYISKNKFSPNSDAMLLAFLYIVGLETS